MEIRLSVNKISYQKRKLATKTGIWKGAYQNVSWLTIRKLAIKMKVNYQIEVGAQYEKWPQNRR